MCCPNQTELRTLALQNSRGLNLFRPVLWKTDTEGYSKRNCIMVMELDKDLFCLSLIVPLSLVVSA